MGWFANRKLVTQFLTMFLLMAGIGLVIGLVGLQQTRRVGAILEDIHDNQLLPIQELDIAYRTLTHHRQLILVATQTRDPQERERLLAGLQAEKEAFWKQYGLEMDTRPVPGEKAVWAQVPMAWNRYEAAAARVVALMRAGSMDEARAYSLTELLKSDEAIRDLIALDIRLNGEDADRGYLTSQTAIAHAHRQTIQTICLGIAAAIALGLGFTWFVLRQVGGELTQAATLVSHLAKGELPGGLDLRPGDRTSLMARLQVLVRALEQVTERAGAIGQGDFTRELELLSDQDQLGLAINRMNGLLRAGKAEESRRNWLNDGATALSAALTGDYSMVQLADAAMATMGRYVGAGRGVLYRHHPQDGALDLLGSYLYSPSATRFQVGEGTIGQVALEQQAIRLAPAAEDAPTILTGTSSTQAPCTYTFPLSHEGVLLAVAELASFVPFSELQEDYLNRAGALISPYLFVALQREKVSDLLAVTEEAERQARFQSLQLQDANARLEEQQQQLQQQTEELQQSNAQMEEQQQQLQQQTEELQQSNAQMEEQQQQLEQTGRYKSEFLANMSHELRTPLNAIILLSRMMADNGGGQLGAEQMKWAEVIHRSGHDLLHLINDVLDLSKVEAGRMELHPAVIHSSDLSSECQDLFADTARGKGLTLVIEDQLQGPFTSDRDKLAQILRNLLSNALKFTREGTVTLRMERRPLEPLPLVLSVRDTGIGIQSDKQTMVFEAFHQADGSTSREFGGTGLGLTISLRFAELLGGTIRLTSTPGLGSEFALHLPEAPGEARVAEPASAKDDRDQLAPGRPTILLIDDDPLFGMALVQINRGLGYATVLAGTGAEGLAMARRCHPSGILLDLGLPDMDGAEVLHQLKASQDLAAIPVFVVSSQDRDWARAHTDIVGYLQKPVDDRQLAQAETALLTLIAKADPGAVLVVGTGGITAADLTRLLGQGHSARSRRVLEVKPGEAFRTALAEPSWRLVIIDLAGITLEEGLATAQRVQEARPETAMLFFAVQPPSETDEARLRRYSDSIVIQAPFADRRLLDAMERFLRPAARGEAPKPLVVAAAGGAKVLEGRSILVVDDDPRNLFVLTAALEMSGAKVTNAINGRHALDVLGRTRVDLIFLDIMMPEMDGFQTLAALQMKPQLAQIPVVALTAKAMPQDREKILAAGADDYLSKPVDHKDLIDRAAHWCQQGGPPR